MKIGGIKGGIRGASKSTSATRSRSAGSTKAGKGPSLESHSNSVEISNHSDTLELIQDLVAQQPDVRADEVDRVMNQLRGKKYKVNFEKVAESFLKDAILAALAQKAKKGGQL